MRYAKHLLVLALGTTLLFGLPASLFAQAEWLSPKLGELMFRGDFRETYYPEERVRGQGTDLRIIEHRLSLTSPLWQNSSDALSVSGSVRFQDLDAHAVLPATGVALPGELWEVKFGPTYRHKFENGWIAGANLMVGSASDQPFASLDEVHVGFEVSGGYAFDRFYFEGDGYSNRNENRIDVRNGPFVVGRVSVRF